MESHHFAQRLMETKAWCISCLSQNANHDFRSAELKPEQIENGRGMFDWTSQETQAIINELAGKRAQLLNSRRSEQSLDDIGRVLVFMPHDSLSDGFARQETDGFFDDDNAPAWDTWIGYVDDHLLAWVPSALVELVGWGIQVNPEQCILWATDLDLPFLRHPAVQPLL